MTATYAEPFNGIGTANFATGLAAQASAALQAAIANPTSGNVAAAQATMAAVATAQNNAILAATATAQTSPVQQAIEEALAAEAEGVEDAMQIAAALGQAMRAEAIIKQDLALAPVLAKQEAMALAAQALTAGEQAIAEAAGATPAEAAEIVAGLSLLCEVFEAGLSAELGGSIGLNLALALATGASAGVSATCCGYTIGVSFGFLINFQLPPILNLLLLLPYLGFTISCDPTKPTNLAAGMPWGGGRQQNAPLDPDDNEDSC